MQYRSTGQAYTVIDAHAHIFPGKIAERASESVGSFYGIPMRHAGFPHTLKESGARAGVSRYLVCSVATKPQQVTAINDFLARKCQEYPEFLGLSAMHPMMEGWEAEVERAASMGFLGFKFHSDFQGFPIDDPKAITVYKKIAKLRLPILFHMGDPRSDASSPQRLYRALEQVPDLVCIAAHFGGWQRWEGARRYLKAPNIYFDTSSSLMFLQPAQAVELLYEHGIHRFFWGTDFPMWSHRQELERFLSLGLPPEDNRRILAENFIRFFHLDDIK